MSYGLLLAKVGRGTEAKIVFTDLLTQMRRAPKYVRKVQAEWIAGCKGLARLTIP